MATNFANTPRCRCRRPDKGDWTAHAVKQGDMYISRMECSRCGHTEKLDIQLNQNRAGHARCIQYLNM